MSEQDQPQDETIETQEVETTEREVNPDVQAMFDEAAAQLDEEYGIEQPEETEEEETTAVEESGVVVAETEEEPAEDSGDVTAEEGGEQTLSEFDTALAKTYGLTDSDLEGMTQKELQRALRLIQVARGPAQQQQTLPQQPAASETSPQPQQTQQPTQPVTDSDIDALIEKMRDEGYGDEQIQLAETLARQNKHLQEQMQQQQLAWQQREMQMQQARQQQEINDFVAGVNAHIKEPDLFGTEAGATQQQTDNLRQLWEQAQLYRDVMQRQGRFVALSDPQLLKEAAKSKFGSHFTKKERASQLASAKKQSARRMGSPSKSKPNDKPTLPWDGSPETDPELKKFAAERGLQM